LTCYIANTNRILNNLDTLSEITNLQRATYDEDNMCAYAWRVRKYFADAGTAIDLGCGIGYQTLQLSKLVPDVHFDMLDKTGVEKPNQYSDAGYLHNNLDMTLDYVLNHNINASVWDVYEYTWDTPVDVVISTLSWGWHYPVELYIDQVLSVTPKYIIFDNRLPKPPKIKNYALVDRFTINRKEVSLVYQSLLQL
jgi:hypothetical protein